MKTKTTLILSILLLVASSFSVFGQKSDFSGEWKLNKEKTVLAEGQLYLSKVTVQLNSDGILTTRVYEDGYGQQYPFDEPLTLDGKECKIVIYDMPRTTKATRSKTDGSLIIESTTTFYGNSGEENLTAKETWKVDNEGKMLTIVSTNKMADTEYSGTSYYDKVN